MFELIEHIATALLKTVKQTAITLGIPFAIMGAFFLAGCVLWVILRVIWPNNKYKPHQLAIGIWITMGVVYTLMAIFGVIDTGGPSAYDLDPTNPCAEYDEGTGYRY